MLTAPAPDKHVEAARPETPARRVLMVSPHFPPDGSAASHRVRLLAPHLPAYGWAPTVVAVDPRDCGTPRDDGLAALVPPTLRVVRCRAWPVARARRIGIGDLGLRAMGGLYRTCGRLLRRERFDAVFLTIFPAYPAVLAPLLRRRYGVPVVLDYQDPWIGAWGRSVGGGPGGAPDLKSRLSRAVASLLEPVAIGGAAAITAVSAGTYEPLRARYRRARELPCVEIPVGGEPSDFEALRRHPARNPYFDARDGAVHLCYVGTLLPLGVETLRAVLGAAARLRDREPDLYGRLRLHFFGTSNRSEAMAPERVRPLARELGVADRVTEVASRIEYLSALRVQSEATALLLMGSSERHYTASKLYPALLARRPLLAVYHEASSVVTVLRATARPPTARVVTYDDAEPVATRGDAVYEALRALVAAPRYDPADIDAQALASVSAARQAAVLAGLLDRVARPVGRCGDRVNPTGRGAGCQP
jgi:glycosyltransferase involved in cell wall biosynthesis